MAEEWRSVIGYEGLYEVSSLGYVRSVYRGRNTGRVLAFGIQGKGRRGVVLGKGGVLKNHTVASLVAAAFIGPANGLYVLHRNDDKTDDSLENLRYGTPQDNSDDMVRNGHSLKGEKHHKSKLTEAQVVKIKQSLLTSTDYQWIADAYGVSKATVQSIKHGRNWGWLSVT